MGSRCELLINVVTIDMPQATVQGMALTGVAGYPSWNSGYVSIKPPAERQALTQSCDAQGTWEPQVIALWAGDPQGKLSTTWD